MTLWIRYVLTVAKRTDTSAHARSEAAVVEALLVGSASSTIGGAYARRRTEPVYGYNSSGAVDDIFVAANPGTATWCACGKMEGADAVDYREQKGNECDAGKRQHVASAGAD